MDGPAVLVGTSDGFHVLGGSAPGLPPGRRMHAVARDRQGLWALSDGDTLWRHAFDGEGEPVVTSDAEQLTCLLPTSGGLLVGAGAATLYRLEAGRLLRDSAFDAAPGRDTWHTPWGGPPDVRSMAADGAGTLYVNVHVGGVLRSVDAGANWEDTMDIGNDVHEVIGAGAGRAHVAAAVGLGTTVDGGRTWSFDTNGLVAPYCRAVALSDAMVFVSASLGPRGGRAGVYRRPRDGSAPLERCTHGLPEWFSGNVDTFCLAASNRLVVAGDPAGDVYVSEDDGATWDRAASGLPGVFCIGLV